MKDTHLPLSPWQSDTTRGHCGGSGRWKVIHSVWYILSPPGGWNSFANIHRKVGRWSKCHSTAHIKAHAYTHVHAESTRVKGSLAGQNVTALHIKAPTYIHTTNLSDVKIENPKEGLAFPHFLSIWGWVIERSLNQNQLPVMTKWL